MSKIFYINNNNFHHLGRPQMCAGAWCLFRISKSHSERLWFQESSSFISNHIIYRVSQKKVGSQKTSNCSNSLNFEAKIKCNTIKPNVPKWRKTCTGLKFDLLDFYGLRAIYILFEIPLFFDSPCTQMKFPLMKQKLEVSGSLDSQVS